MKKEKFDIGSISDGGNFGMNLKRIGIIVGAHVVAIGVFYLAGSVGSSDDEGAALAGANGLKIWDSQSPNAMEPTVDPSSMKPFDSRASNLSGYNAGDAPRTTLLASSNLSSPSSASSNAVNASNSYDQPNPVPVLSGQRYEPQRPDGYSSNRPADSGDYGYSSVPNSNFDAPQLPPTMIKYTIAKGDSIWGIGRKFNITTKDITDANPGLKVNTIRVGQILNIPQPAARSTSRSTPVAQNPVVTDVDGSVYVVKSGDSLSKIAANQGTTLNALKVANGLDNDLIRVGQKLRIPNVSSVSSIVSTQREGLRVTVQSGDSISSIASRHGVSSKELMSYNDVDDPRLLQVGQVLYVPQKNGGRQIEVEASRPEARRDTRPPARTSQVATPEPKRTPPAPTPTPAQPTISFEDDNLLLDEAKVEAPVIPIED